jgi:hypothetical protein
MNTGGRKLSKRSIFKFEDELLKELVDQSKLIKVKYSRNNWDKSINLASQMTQKFVEKAKKVK